MRRPQNFEKIFHAILTVLMDSCIMFFGVSVFFSHNSLYKAPYRAQHHTSNSRNLLELILQRKDQIEIQTCFYYDYCFYIITLKYPIKEHALLLIFNILPPLLAFFHPARLLIFRIISTLLVYSIPA